MTNQPQPYPTHMDTGHMHPERTMVLCCRVLLASKRPGGWVSCLDISNAVDNALDVSIIYGALRRLVNDRGWVQRRKRYFADLDYLPRRVGYRLLPNWRETAAAYVANSDACYNATTATTTPGTPRTVQGQV